MKTLYALRQLASVLALALAAAFTLAGCGDKVSLPRLAPDAVVLAFGDSLTAGSGAAQSESYPAVLERAIGRKVVNAGVPGELSGAGLQRLPGVLDDVRPQLVVLIHGGNDLLRKLDENVAATNVRTMIETARTRGIPVVLIGVPKPALMPGTAGFYAEIARAYRLPYDGETLRAILTDNALKSDLVHPNAAGYAKLGAAVAKLLTQAGAL